MTDRKAAAADPDRLADTLRELASAIRESTLETRALRAELRTGREKSVKTRRVKALRRAAEVQDVPVSDIAAAAARRALSKLKR